MHDWGVGPGNKRKIGFRFKQQNYPEINNVQKEVRQEGICTSSSLFMYAQIDGKFTGFTGNIESINPLVFYPSVPPSGKILTAEGNRDYDLSVLIRLPSASEEFLDASWAEFGIEITMQIV